MEENKKAHLLDLKLPLGGLLSFYGIILVLYGLFAGKEAYEKSLGININFFWGALILVIGAALLLSSFRKPRPPKT
jgi:membrane-bound ClpP family serine protease